MNYQSSLVTPALGVTTYLGPAQVVAVEGHDITVKLPAPVGHPENHDVVKAELALAFPYQPVLDDTLLLIATADRHYIIGVIAGKGHVALDVQGDIRLRAAGGKLELMGDKGVSIESPAVDIHTSKLQMFAESITQKVSFVYTWVKELFSMRAGKSRTIVDHDSYHQATNSTMAAADAVKVYGRQVHLGNP